jgi:hypothetical protein
VSHTIASSRDAPHISACGCSPEQHAGRDGEPKIAHCRSARSCTQRTPAGLPLGIPGIGLVMDGAMQHAPQPGRHACPGTSKGEPALTEIPETVDAIRPRGRRTALCHRAARPFYTIGLIGALLNWIKSRATH